MPKLQVPREVFHVGDVGSNILYNPEMHSWDSLTDEELNMYEMFQEKGGVDCSQAAKEVQSYLFRLVFRGLLYPESLSQSVERVKEFPDSPTAVYWEVTDRCNMECLYCFADGSAKNDQGLSTYEGFRVLESIATSNTQWIYFTGGEPLLREDLFDLAQFCKDLGIKTGLLTNATLIDRDIAGRIAGVFDSVAISLDSASPGINDSLRGAKTHAKALNGLYMLLDQDVKPAVNTTVTNLNLSDIPQLIRLLSDLGLSEHRLSIHMAIGRGKDDALGCDENEILWALEEMIRNGAWLNLKKESYSFFQARLPEPFKPKCQCGFGTNELLVDALGNVFPCRLLKHKELLAGNVLREPLSKIYTTSTALSKCRAIDVDEIPNCSMCTYRYFCGGGCRALAFHATGDITAHISDMCNVYKREFDFLLTQGNFWKERC
jgi:radical SAM protein with 4Fe4S-binding SPASM domain